MVFCVLSVYAYELRYEQDQVPFAMLPVLKSGPASLGAFVTFGIRAILTCIPRT